MFSKFLRSLSAGKRIAFVAFFLALSVVANMFSFDVTPSLKITVTYLVLFYAAFYLGAIPAFAVGFIGDALGFLLMPSGMYWLFGLTLGCFGFLAGIALHCIPVKWKGAIYWKTAIALAACYVLITLLLNSVVNYYYVNIFIWQGIPQKTFLVYFAGRVSLQTVVYAVNAALTFLLLPVAKIFQQTVDKKCAR